MQKITLFIFLMMAAAGVCAAQPKAYKVIREGVGIEGIKVGKSTAMDVTKKFGAARREANKKYSYQLTYDRRGLSYYYCQSDKKETIFLIEIKKPYLGKTSRGVILGESTKEETEKIYGKPRNGFEYKGVNFYYNRYGRRNLISEIDVLENKGLRQCGVK